MKYHTTKKLFYKKYPYKIVFSVPGAWKLKRLGITGTKKWLYGNTNITTWMSPLFDRVRLTKTDKESLYKFINLIEPFLAINSIKYRIEYRTFSIYLENSDIIPNIEKTLQEYITQLWKPADTSTANFLKEHVNTIMCKKLPFDTYNYKISVRQTLSDDTKQSFYNWVVNKNQQESILKLPDSFIEYLNGERLWTGSNYFYLKEESDLIFISLLLDKHILKVEKYQIEKNIKELNILSNKDNINACTEQTV